MKKIAVIAVVIILLNITAPFMTVYATDNTLSITMYTDDTIKPQKAFNLYIYLASDTVIGNSHITVSYNPDTLTLKNVSLENKSSDDTLYFNDITGQADIITFAENIPHHIVLRFQPTDTDTATYNFETTLYEACDLDGNYITCYDTCQLLVNTGNSPSASQQVSVQSASTVHASVSSNPVTDSRSPTSTTIPEKKSPSKTSSRNNLSSQQISVSPNTSDETAEISSESSVASLSWRSLSG